MPGLGERGPRSLNGTCPARARGTKVLLARETQGKRRSWGDARLLATGFELDAAACGFDVTKPTPFNGEHKAGPLAMISLPDAETGLGPLCTKPDTSVSPARCDP